MRFLKHKVTWMCAVALPVLLLAQTGNLSIISGVINFGSASHTATVKIVASAGALPSSGCTVGELAIVTGATLGQQIYTNSGSGTCTWTQNSGGVTSVTQGAYAALPATCNVNDLYLFTDSVYTGRCSSTNTWSLFYQGAMLVTVPPTAGWTGDNTSSSAGTQSSTQGYLYSTFTNASATNARFFYRTAPATPYSVTALISFDLLAAGGTGNEVGLLFGFRDSGGKLVVWMLQKTGGAAKTGDFKWNSTSSAGSYYTSQQAGVSNSLLYGRNPVWLRIRDCGSSSTGSCTGLNGKIQFSYSFDGQNWIQFDAQSRTDFMGSGPNAYGYGAYVGDGAVNTFLYSLLEGS